MAKRKVKIKRLPEGYKMVNGSVVKTMALGGVPRDKANLEAEKGETVLTDLDNDGAHELYNIGGKRHSEGGTPLSLPPQSFIFSDTAKMKFSSDELAELGIDSKKKQTPAWASKRFKLNKFIENMNNEHSDKISDETSELMLDKNKLQLSKIAFMAEAKKDFLDEEGNISVPLAAYPFLISKGIDPKEFIAKLEEIKAAKEQTQQAPLQGEDDRQQAMQQPAPQLQDFTGGPPQGPQGPPPQGPQGPQQGPPQGPQQGPSQGVQQIIAKVIEALQQGMQPEEIMQKLVQMGIPEEQAMGLLQKVIQDVQGQQGPPQGMSAQGPPPPMPPQGGPPQGGMPPEMMMAMQQQGQGMPPQGPPSGMMPPPGMARYGGHPLSRFVYGGSLPSARHGNEEKYAQFHDLSQEDYDAAVNAYLSEQDANLGNTTTGQITELGSGPTIPAITDRGLPLGTTTQGQTVVPGDNVLKERFGTGWEEAQAAGYTVVNGEIIPPTTELGDAYVPANRSEFQKPFTVQPRSLLGNVGTRFGNIFRSDEKDIDPTRYIRENSGEKTNMLLSEFVYGGDTEPCYECGGDVPKFQGEDGSSEFNLEGYFKGEQGWIPDYKGESTKETLQKINRTGSPFFNKDGTLKPNPFDPRNPNRMYERWENAFGEEWIEQEAKKESGMQYQEGIRGPSEFNFGSAGGPGAGMGGNPCQELEIVRERLLQELQMLEMKSGPKGKDVIQGTIQKLEQVDRDIQKCMIENTTQPLEERILPGSLHATDEQSLMLKIQQLQAEIAKIEGFLASDMQGTVNQVGQTKQNLFRAMQEMKGQLAQLMQALGMIPGMGSAGGPGNQPGPAGSIPIPNANPQDFNFQSPGGPYKMGSSQMEQLRYGGDPFATNPLHKFVYGGSLPKAQNSEETDPCDPALQAKCEAVEGTTWVKNGANCQCKCPEGLDWMGSGCVNTSGAIIDENEENKHEKENLVPDGGPHDHNGDGIADHEDNEHVGEYHGANKYSVSGTDAGMVAEGDVKYQCTDVDPVTGECISFETAHETHTTFEDVMRHEDFGTARDVWWDVYTKGRAEQSGYKKDGNGEFLRDKNNKKIPETFHIGSQNASLFKEGDKDQMMDNYFEYNQVLHDLKEHGLDPGDAGQDFFTHAQSLGYFKDLTEEQVKTKSMNFQGMYRALNIAKRTEETSGLFANIETLPQGEEWKEGSTHFDQWGNPVSSIDAKIGKTSKFQHASAVNPIITPEKESPCPGKPADFDVEAARIACEKKNAIAVNAEGTAEGSYVTDAYMWNAHRCECEHAPGDYIPPDRVPMIPWVQDENNLTNAIMNKGMREDFYPMMEQYNFTPADMLRDDPLSRIHASNSLAQTAIDAGADPYTIFSQAAGENRKSIADVQSRDVAEYNALDRANMTGKQTIDQANMLARVGYVDDINTVGTNRINTEIADNQNIVTAHNNLIGNAQHTQAMSELRKNYNVNPQATPWNNQSLIEFANAQAYQDEVGGGGGGVGMSYTEAYAHASAPKPDGLGLEGEHAINWAKNYIAANKGNNSTFVSGHGSTTENGYPARYGGERQRRRSGAALRQWMRGGMK